MRKMHPSDNGMRIVPKNTNYLQLKNHLIVLPQKEKLKHLSIINLG